MNTLQDFKNAQQTLEKVLLPTHLIHSPQFSKTSGNNVYLKPENLQRTGSFKLRGAYYKISTLSDEQKKKGIVTSSAGNHAQGVAYSAQDMGILATIVMPEATPLVKVNNTKSYGANVVLTGDCYDAAYGHAMELSKEHGYEFVHAFNDVDVATGQGTLAFDILKDLPEADIILIPIGGGGLAAGVATLAKLLNPRVTVMGVEPTGAASMKESIAQNKVTTLTDMRTIADGIAVKTPGDVIFPYVQENLDGIITVDDDELVDVFLDMMEGHKMVVENAGLVTLAALRHLDVKDKNIVSVLSGGNMDILNISSHAQLGLINRGRIFTFTVALHDKPGELSKVSTIVGKKNGNIISVEYNRFLSANASKDVELAVTVEAFGHEHKEEILDKLRAKGYDPKLVPPRGTF